MSEENKHEVGIKLESGCVELNLDGSVFKLGLNEDGIPEFPEPLEDKIPSWVRFKAEKAAGYAGLWGPVWNKDGDLFYWTKYRETQTPITILWRHCLERLHTELGAVISILPPDSDDDPSHVN